MAKSSRILDTVHRTATALRRAGAIDVQTMKEFDAHCLTPVKPLQPKDIQRLRLRLKTSQAVFAAYLNTSVSTVQKWETGEKRPSGAALKLLNVIERKGLEVIT